MSDPIDAVVVLTADTGDRIITGDVDDIGQLVGVAGRSVAVVAC